MLVTASRELVVPTAARWGAPNDAEAMRLMRITGKCVFDDIFRGPRKR